MASELGVVFDYELIDNESGYAYTRTFCSARGKPVWEDVRPKKWEQTHRTGVNKRELIVALLVDKYQYIRHIYLITCWKDQKESEKKRKLDWLSQFGGSGTV